MRLGLAARMVLTVALLLIPAALWLGYSFEVERQQVAREVEARLGRHVAAVSLEVEQELRLTRQNLLILTNVSEVQADAATCTQTLVEFNISHPWASAFAKADTVGRVECSSAEREPFDVGQLEVHRTTMRSGGFTIGHLPPGLLTEGPAVLMGYPVHDDQQKIEGVVLAVMDVERFLDLRAMRSLPPDSIVTVVDEQGTVIARSSDAVRYVGRSIADSDLRGADFTGGRLLEAEGVDGVTRLYVSGPVEVPGESVLVLVGVPADEAYAPVVEDAKRSGAFTGVLLGLVAIATVLAMRRVVVTPMQHIAEVAHEHQAGRLEARIRPELAERSDEIGTLAAMLNAHAAQVVQQINELEHANLRLGELDRIKTVIIDGIAHELRTPLLVVDHQVERLKQRFADTEDEALAKALEMTERNVKRLGRLVEGVIQVANIQAGRADMTIETVRLRELLEGLGKAWAEPAEQYGLRFSVTSTDAVVRADAGALREVLDQLVENAMKFTPPGGAVALDVEAGADTVAIRVQDTGIGMEADGAATVEPFERRGIPIRGGRIGVGVGLFIARAQVVIMGGTLDIESAGLGQGTTITVRLPVA